jgi:hypothetical protein
MVLVPVRKQYPLYLVLVLYQIGEVGDDKVHPQHIALGEGNSAVDNHDIAAIFYDDDVLADFLQAPKRKHFQLALFRQIYTPLWVIFSFIYAVI